VCAVRWLRVLRVPHVSTASTCSVHRMRARVRSATPPSSSPPYSIRDVVFRRGVRRGPGNFAGDPSVPSHQARGAPPGQGPLHRTPAYPRTNDKTATPFPLRPSRTEADSRLGPLHRTHTHAPTTKQQPNAAPTRRSRTDHSQARLCARVPATQGAQLMMGAALLISFTGPKSPLFDMARAAGSPRTLPHPHTHAGTRTCAR
jgi:hypothetical protein